MLRKNTFHDGRSISDAFLYVFLEIKLFERLKVAKIRLIRDGILDFLECEIAAKGQNGPTRPEKIFAR